MKKEINPKESSRAQMNGGHAARFLQYLQDEIKKI